LAAGSLFLGLPALAAVLLIVSLGCIDAVRVIPPNQLRTGRNRFRAGVAALCLAQPLVRAWGRMSTTSAARRDLAPSAPLIGPARAFGDVLSLPNDGPRERATTIVVDVVRRAGLSVVSPTGWEDWDAHILGSLLVAGHLVTSGHLDGTIQIRVRRRIRLVATICAVALVVVAAMVHPALGVAAAAIATLEALRGVLRTGPVVRRAIVRAAGGMA
jgi:hypothetical protein